MRGLTFVLGLVVCGAAVYAHTKGVSAARELVGVLAGISLMAWATFPRDGA